MKKILVTGGAGYIGSHCVKELLKAGHEVHVIDNLVHGHKDAVLSRNFHRIDLAEKPKIESFFRKVPVDAVIHFAAYAYVGESVQEPMKYYYNNTVNSLNLLSAMKTAGVKRIVFSSTCSTYGNVDGHETLTESLPQNPINPYAKTKHMIEQIIKDFSRAYGFKYCLLRYFNAAGADLEGSLGEDHRPETHLIPLVLKAALSGGTINVFGKDYQTKDGTCVRDYIHVTDLADAHIRALDQMDKADDFFNLGSGKGFSVLEVIRKCEEVTGKKININVTGRREGDPAMLVADNTKAKKMLGWVCGHSDIDTVVSSAWNWMKLHPNGYKR